MLLYRLFKFNEWRFENFKNFVVVILVWKQRKKHLNEDNIRNDVITLRSIRSLLNTSRTKILYTDILPKISNMVAKIFFPSGRPHLANHPLPLSAFVHLPDPPHPLMCRHSFWMAPNENKTKLIWKLLMLFSKKSLQA